MRRMKNLNSYSPWIPGVKCPDNVFRLTTMQLAKRYPVGIIEIIAPA